MCTRRHGGHDPFLMFRPSGLSDAQAVSLVGLLKLMFGEQQISTLADAIRAALMLRYN